MSGGRTAPAGRQPGAAPQPLPLVALIRHASAGTADAWSGDDRLRPLDARGLLQAAALTVSLAALGVGRIVTSPYLRCRQTVEPLAAALGLRVEPAEALAEGSAEAAWRLLRGVGTVPTALCSHGDVLPPLLQRVSREDSLDLGRVPRCEKGSAWLLHGVGASRFTLARYLPPRE